MYIVLVRGSAHAHNHVTKGEMTNLAFNRSCINEHDVLAFHGAALNGSVAASVCQTEPPRHIRVG